MEEVEEPNETAEAYTGNHIGHKGDRPAARDLRHSLKACLHLLIKHDLSQRHPQTMRTGRPSTPVEVILPMLIVKRLCQRSYEATERHVSDRLVLRRFCRLYFELVPDDTTLIRWAGTIEPETLTALDARVTAMARALKIIQGRKLRTDGTVVECNIRHPTDSRLLADGVGVLSRTLKRAQRCLQDRSELSKSLFRDRTRSARWAARRIARSARHSSAAGKQTYRRLIATSRACLRQTRQVAQELEQVVSQSATRLRTLLETFIPRTEQVIEQTVRCVFQGQKLLLEQKLVSIFEPHTDILKTGKSEREAVFGHKVRLDEVDGGILSGYRILDGNPGDGDQPWCPGWVWLPSLDHHVEQFGHPPWLISADPEDNEKEAAARGVKRVILPKPGAKSAERRQYERRSWFRRRKTLACWDRRTDQRGETQVWSPSLPRMWPNRL